MNKVDYDKSKFKTDSHGNLIPVAEPKKKKAWKFGDSLADVVPDKRS